MFLKSLEISGFKSFPDKTRLSFPHGITAVVGPNGSGKSNISDAIRWVLGEQSTKTLRSAKMDEVIFSGTPGRRSMGRARVTLVLDNTDRTLPIQEDEVAVERTFYRDGEGEYRINGVGVRLRDVHELFMDTGLGRDGYALIGQGRIGQIINQRSEERREIFEEAAGISKFRFRKEEAEKRLKSAQENLLRLMDILSELEERLEPLRVQAQKAQRFIELSAEKKELEISLWVHQLRQMEEQLRQLRHEKERLEQQKEEAAARLLECEAAMEENFTAMQQNAARAEGLRETLAGDEAFVAQSSARQAVLENEEGHKRDAIRRLQEELAQGETVVRQLESRMEEQSRQVLALQETTQELSRQMGALQEKEASLSESESQLQERLQEQERQRQEQENAAGAVRVVLASAAAKLHELGERLETFDASEQQRRQKRESLLEEQREAQALLDQLAGVLEGSQNVLRGLQMKRESRLGFLEEMRRSHASTEKTMAELRQRIQILEDLERNLEGYSHSVQYILKQGLSGRLQGICAAVSQVVSTKDEFFVAIETALGGAMQNIITQDEVCAKQAIAALKKSGQGRATFLPLSTLQPRSLPELSRLAKEPGILGTADSLVECEERYRPAVRFLLGRTVVAETIDTALDVGKKFRFAFKLVTLDGQVVNPGGSLTGGSASRQTGVLTRRHTIEKLTRQLQESQPQWEAERAKLEARQQEIEKLDAELEARRAGIQTAREDQIRAQGERERVVRQLGELAAVHEDARRQRELLLQAQGQQEEFLEEQKVREQELAQRAAASAQEYAQLLEQLREVRERRQGLVQEKNEEAIQHLGMQKDLQSAQEGMQRLLEEQALLARGRQEKLQECERLSQQSRQIAQEKEELGKQAGDAAGRITQSRQALQETSAKRLELEAKSVTLRNEQKRISAVHDEHIGRLAAMEEKLGSRVEAYERVVSQIWEEYELSKARAFEAAKPLGNPQEASKRLMQLRLSIKNLGSVNLQAVEEYAEVSKRRDFMKEQMDDAQNAKDRLTKMIFELTSQMREIFIEKFRKINYNFSQTFRDLFGGGQAALEMDSDDVLTAGILIKVQPPGKLIRNLAALSGGEQALTAIALYFAILQVQPAPFCVLDEIEAALDDVNVARFAQYLRKLNVDTQFVAITHRRGTMEQADVLYGVTMQEEGVSTLLELSMAQVQQRWQLN